MSVGGRMRHVHHAVSAALPVLFAYVQTAKVRKPTSPFALTLLFLLAVVSSIWRWRRNRRAHSTPRLSDRANTADKKGIQRHPKAITFKHEALLVQPKTLKMLSKLSSFLRKQRIENQDCRVSQQASPKTVAQADCEACESAVYQETLRPCRLSSREYIRAALTRQSRTLLNKAVFKTAFTLADRIDAIASRGDFIDLRAAVAIYYTESLSRAFVGARLRCLDSRENVDIDRFLVAPAAAVAAHRGVRSTSASCHEYLVERMRSVLRGATEQRRHDLRAGRKVRRDLLSSMLSVSLQEVNNKELVETLLEFLCPGLDTMTTSVCNALQLLSQDPIWTYRAQTEVDRVLGDESRNGPGSVVDIDRLPIIRGIFLEALRLFSAPSDRLQKHCFFNPARWVSSGSFCAEDFRLFTKDERTIPGKHVAALQATALLAVLIARFDFCFLPENENTNDRVTVHLLPRST